MPEGNYRYFVTYSGVKLPLKLVNPIEEGGLGNRNTYFRAVFDDQDRPISIEKVVYGEIEMAHRYDYDASGALKTAHITMLDETTVMDFSAGG
jgi:hypothetical protein